MFRKRWMPDDVEYFPYTIILRLLKMFVSRWKIIILYTRSMIAKKLH